MRVGGSIGLAAEHEGGPATGTDADTGRDGTASTGDSGVGGADPTLAPGDTVPGEPPPLASPGDPTQPPTTTPRTPATTAPGTPTTTPPTAVDLRVRDVAVPATADPTVDGCGEPLGFDADHLLDRVDATAWRMEGDGTGATLTLTLEGPRRVRSVGLIPGFDQVDPCDGTDRFRQNRRITEVSWEFDDGQRVSQRLLDVASLQRVDVDATTRTVVLRIRGVTADPTRDYTAISELAVRGI